jgi:hypothetical protein
MEFGDFFLSWGKGSCGSVSDSIRSITSNDMKSFPDDSVPGGGLYVTTTDARLVGYQRTWANSTSKSSHRK